MPTLFWTEEKDFVERLVAWAAIAYAFGFLVVFLHTSRLGLPVVELVEPVFVLTGAPLAALLFASSRLIGKAKRELSRARADLVTALQRETPRSETEADGTPNSVRFDVLMDNLARAASEALPMALPSKWTLWLFRRTLSRVPREQIADPDVFARVELATRRSLRAFGLMAGIKRTIDVIATTVVVVGAVVLYVWFLYPGIPKSFGGGAPEVARLAFKRESVPRYVRELVARGPKTVADSGALLSDPVEILYSTKEGVFIRLSTGELLSIPPENVGMVVWAK